MPSPAQQVQYPHFTTCVRGLCHGITPLFLPADVPGTPLALHHAALCLANPVYRTGSPPTTSPTPTAPAPPRPEAVSWPPPQAPGRRRSAAPPARPPAARGPAPPPRAHARPPAPGGHVVALLPPYQLRLSGLGRVGQYQCQRASQRRPLAPAALQQLWRLLPGEPWHALAWHARGAPPAGVGGGGAGGKAGP